MSWSHPMRVRGLKYYAGGGIIREVPVAPHAGAWIEITLDQTKIDRYDVAPHAGAWIEMSWWWRRSSSA